MRALFGDVSEALKLSLTRESSWGYALQSALLLAVLLLVRSGFRRLIARSQRLPEEKALSLQILNRNFLVAALVVGLLWIWGRELKDLALSLAAIAVALVLATKELLLCLLGSVLRTSGDSFSVGDRIEVGTLRGDVVDHRLLTTTLLEVGPGHQRTGRSLSVPNSIFLITPVINETFTKAYVLHLVKVCLKRDEEWRRAEHLFVEAATEVCAPYLEAARTHMGAMARRHSLQAPMVAPRIMTHFPDAEQVELTVRVPTPAREKGRIEQHILRRFFDKLDRIASLDASSSNPSSTQTTREASSLPPAEATDVN